MIEANFIYVDKTDLLYEIASLKTAFIINAERRTGKTLLLSTIKAMFQQKSEWWQQYGASLKVMAINPNFFAQNPFPVLEFSFSQCPNNERFLKDIRRCLNIPLRNITSSCKTFQRTSASKVLLETNLQMSLMDFKLNTKNQLSSPLMRQTSLC